MKTALILSFKRLDNDPRINRQVQWLSERFRVMTLGPADTAIAGVPCLDSGLQARPNQLRRALQRLGQRYDQIYWQTPHIRISWAKLRALKPELIIANEIECLPLALAAKAQYGAAVVFDAHEFYPGLYDHLPVARRIYGPYIDHLCRKYIHQADACVTTTASMAECYQRAFGIEGMHIVLNAPPYQQISPKETDPEHIRLVHHGLAMPDRRPEEMIDMMHTLDPRFELYLMLVDNNPDYIRTLKQRASFCERIHFVPSVPMQEISQAISHYDIGVHLIPPTNRNNACALANKFFEFIQGRLALAVSPIREMQRMIDQYELGVVSPDFTGKSLAERLNALSIEDIRRYRQNAHHASRELCAERTGQHFLAAVSQALQQTQAPEQTNGELYEFKESS